MVVAAVAVVEVAVAVVDAGAAVIKTVDTAAGTIGGDIPVSRCVGRSLACIWLSFPLVA